MSRYYLEITVKVQDLDRAEIEDLFDPLADAVYDLADVEDADLGARFDDSEFDVTMTVEAEDPPGALAAGLAAVRTAFHVTGGSTAGWEAHFEAIKQVVNSEPAPV